MALGTLLKIGSKALKSPVLRKAAAKGIKNIAKKASKNLIFPKRLPSKAPIKGQTPARSLKEAVDRGITQWTKKVGNRNIQMKVKWQEIKSGKNKGMWKASNKRMKVHRTSKGDQSPNRMRKALEQKTKHSGESWGRFHKVDDKLRGVRSADQAASHRTGLNQADQVFSKLEPHQRAAVSSRSAKRGIHYGSQSANRDNISNVVHDRISAWERLQPKIKFDQTTPAGRLEGAKALEKRAKYVGELTYRLQQVLLRSSKTFKTY
tara:strand:+ start:45 stop:833 length:789 start_codon:yes stop_codon:yes gene_type:complete